MNKHVINRDYEIGPEKSQWKAIHYCAKYNSLRIMRYLLKKIYQEEPEQYFSFINSKTLEGYTPLIITIMSFSTCTM
jgi:hypothetical protein